MTFDFKKVFFAQLVSNTSVRQTCEINMLLNALKKINKNKTNKMYIKKIILEFCSRPPLRNLHAELHTAFPLALDATRYVPSLIVTENTSPITERKMAALDLGSKNVNLTCYLGKQTK